MMAEYQVPGEPRRGTRSETEAERRWSGAASPVLLLCPRCDEAFTPRFYRICPACGCDAGDGYEPHAHSREPLSNRVLLVLYGLIGVTALILLYFWFLFQDAR